MKVLIGTTQTRTNGNQSGQEESQPKPMEQAHTVPVFLYVLWLCLFGDVYFYLLVGLHIMDFYKTRTKTSLNLYLRHASPCSAIS